MLYNVSFPFTTKEIKKKKRKIPKKENRRKENPQNRPKKSWKKFDPGSLSDHSKKLSVIRLYLLLPLSPLPLGFVISFWGFSRLILICLSLYFLSFLACVSFTHSHVRHSIITETLLLCSTAFRILDH
ncbi:hypothetical protein N665_0844s0033 [Sinapis alba]|nr:hypothetical protein N665_0844s0033 [Sinapis alba]